jgi:ElaB/YqjD/DUF883 family membrane-anchored ribosome-binding protein
MARKSRVLSRTVQMLAVQIRVKTDMDVGAQGGELTNSRNLPPQSTLQAEAKIRRVLRGFVTTLLREGGHTSLADRLDEETEKLLAKADDMRDLGELLRQMAEKLNSERSEELESMCERLCISQHNARTRFRKAIHSLFVEETSWNQIVTMITFTGHVAVYCANLNMEEQSVEVVDEADTFLHDKLLPWILERGGWAEFTRNITQGQLVAKAVTGITSAVLWGLTKLLPS